MGDPKRQKKKYSKPGHPWQKERIDAEKEIMKLYGLRRKYEIWTVDSALRNYLNRAKTIIARRTSQSEIERKQLLDRLTSLGLLKANSKVEDVLNLTLKDMMERRLQTLVYKKQIAKTMLQARQLITHEHIAINEKKITSPSYIVPVSEEQFIKLAHPINLNPQEAKKE